MCIYIYIFFFFFLNFKEKFNLCVPYCMHTTTSLVPILTTRLTPLYPFALPHLPLKRLSILNLESLHLSSFSCIWRSGQEDFASYVSAALKFSACGPSFRVTGRFHPELRSHDCWVTSQRDACVLHSLLQAWTSRDTVLFKWAMGSL